MRWLQVCCLLLALFLVVSIDGKRKHKKDSRSSEQRDLDEKVDRYYNLGSRRRDIFHQRGHKGPGRHQHKSSEEDRWWEISTVRPIYRWTTDRPFWKTGDKDDSSDSSSDEYGRWGFDSWRKWGESSSSGESSSDESNDKSDKSHAHSMERNSKHDHSKGKHSKHEHSKSKESSSLESSSESSEESWEERLNEFWCEKWCWKWATHFKNFNRLFPQPGFYRRINKKFKKTIVKPFCRNIIESSGIMCNYNKTESVTTTTAVTPTSTKTAPRPLRRCRSALHCEIDECCAMRNERDAVGLYCTRYSQEGEQCTSAQYWLGSERRVRPSMSCPCADGLRCDSSSVAGKRYRYPREGTCQVSTTTGPPTVTTDPEVITRLPSNNETEPSNNVTDGISCRDHMDCPFFQCCSNMTAIEFGDETSTGTCMPFSDEGDYCSKLDSLLERSVVPACPCQSFLTCSSTSTDVDGSVGVCV